MSNNTKIKYLNVADKIYQVINISFFHMTLEAVETNLTAAKVSEDELWNLEEFEKYEVKLVNNGGEGKIVDFESYKGEMDKQLWDGSKDGKTKGIIEIFKNVELGSVRVVTIRNEPYFVGKDVAEILGYMNASKVVLTHVDNEDKAFVMFNISDSQNGNLFAGQTKTAVINESGLYSLILSSN